LSNVPPENERPDPVEEITPEISAYYAANEMHYGRISWLAEHIRISNFQINHLVARKLLSMIERSQDGCFYEIQIVRRRDIPPARKDPQLESFRHFDMALELARRNGFDRKFSKKARHEVASMFGVNEATLLKLVRPYKKMALESFAEECAEMRARASNME
jgi:hypothetical protein